MLVAPTEPKVLQAMGKVSLLPESYGADILFPAPHGLVGIQRKAVPDLIASVQDGRLAKETRQMRQLAIKLLIIEGNMDWTTEGYWTGRNGWTKAQHHGLLWSMQLRGIWVTQTATTVDTAEVVSLFRLWLAKPHHRSLDNRPRPGGTWGKMDGREEQEWLLQGFTSLGPVTAAAIIDHFGNVPLAWTCTEKELCGVPGVGKALAKRWMNL